MSSLNHGAVQDQTSETDDRTLLAACQRGETAAWEELLGKYERLVFSVARSSGLSTDDAADVTQITFAYLLQSLAVVHPETVSGWLATVARRHSWRLQKRRQREHAREINDDVFDSSFADSLFPGRIAADPLDRWELVEWLHHALARLNDRCRRLLIALYFDEQKPSYQAIAEALQMAEGSIGPTRARCLKQMRQLLEEANQSK
ncbi:MAG: sigma-70 family RNA polymerase sigma factor [Caldilineaceae bacterium]